MTANMTTPEQADEAARRILEMFSKYRPDQLSVFDEDQVTLARAYTALVAERDKWKRAFEIKSRAADRYLPCPDCRDKVEAGDCQRCRRQTAERKQATAESKLADVVAERDALRTVVEQFVGAVDRGALQLNSEELGEPENDIPMHPWHEELLYHARAALRQG